VADGGGLGRIDREVYQLARHWTHPCGHLGRCPAEGVGAWPTLPWEDGRWGWAWRVATRPVPGNRAFYSVAIQVELTLANQGYHPTRVGCTRASAVMILEQKLWQRRDLP